MSEKTTQLIEEVKALTVLELSELVMALEEEFGVSAAAPVAVAAAPAEGGAAAAEEEQTEFDVILTNVGDQKIKVIKVVREVTGLGLKEAKAVVDEAPKPLKEGATKEEAEEIKKKIEEVGGTAEIK
jgi:large subunit ribosomal protein L7/L12